MNLYAFELGREKELCFAELISVLEKSNFVERNFNTAIFKLDLLDPQKLQNRLGGTIKIVEILEKISQKSELEPAIQKILENHFKNRVSGKVQFSISLLGFKNERDINIKQSLNFSKKILKSLGFNSRFVNKGPISPKPSTIYKARVLKKGIDINIIKGEKDILIGKTAAIQDIDAYSLRDYNKPYRDARVGMLPPKLAQIMINLAPEAKTIYDPFCGTGTIPMEGLLMGKNVIGSDIDTRMVEYTKKNCEWLKNFFDIGSSSGIFQKDARFLLKKDLPIMPDAVITEGYLGKPLTRAPSEKELEIIFREIENLYFNFLRTIKPILAENSKIVICAPAFKIGQKTAYLPRLRQLAAQAGYGVEKNFTYQRPDQLVAREIVVLAPQPQS